MVCANCERDRPVERHHVHLESDEVMEMDLCEACRHKFATADWVDAVV